MSERLTLSEGVPMFTDDELVDMLGMNQGNGDAYATRNEVRLLITELRERRAADLSAEDVEALRWVRNDTDRALNPVADDGHDCDICNARRRALSVLDRIINGGGR